MKLFLFVSLIACSSLYAGTCVYGISTCEKNQACIKTDPSTAVCIAESANIPEAVFPLLTKSECFCDQGNLSSADNSHTYTNTAYALDLASNRDNDAGIVIASASGTIISYANCKTSNDQCGNGFGNYVQILKDDGYLFFYAHLEKVFVHTGDKVQTGQIIGVEGNSGWTGENNRHLHFSVHFNWKNLGADVLKNNIGWLPDSVPFKLNACQPDQKNCLSTFTDSRNFKCTRDTTKINWIKIL